MLKLPYISRVIVTRHILIDMKKLTIIGIMVSISIGLFIGVLETMNNPNVPHGIFIAVFILFIISCLTTIIFAFYPSLKRTFLKYRNNETAIIIFIICLIIILLGGITIYNNHKSSELLSQSNPLVTSLPTIISTLTPQQIVNDIKAQDYDLQQGAINRYVGQTIKWDVTISSYNPNQNGVYICTYPINETSPIIAFTINPKDYPQLIKQDQTFTVEGKIASINNISYAIDLNNCKLTFPTPAPTSH